MWKAVENTGKEGDVANRKCSIKMVKKCNVIANDVTVDILRFSAKIVSPEKRCFKGVTELLLWQKYMFRGMSKLDLRGEGHTPCLY